MQLSVIIVNYNVRPFLENALVSLQKAMAGVDGEVYVVDNASDDGSVEMLRSKFPAVHLITNSRNTGFAEANNRALRQTKGRFILLINPDTVVQEDTLRTMIEFFEHNPDVGLAGCKILNPDGSLQLACRRSFPTPWVAFTKIIGLSSLLPNTKLFGKYNLTYLNPEETYEVDAVSGSFMFVRQDVLKQVGGLDEQFFMYGEDLDWCYRIQRAGWKIFYVHSTRIIHYKGESAKRSDIDELKLFYEAMHLFVKKHFRRPSVSHLILRGGIALRAWVAFFAKVVKPLAMMTTDWGIVILSFGLAEYLHVRQFFAFPEYAYPAMLIVPGAVIVTIMLSLGVYTLHPFTIKRSIGSVAIGYVLISALTFFFKDYAFSRLMVIYSGVISLIALPGWRLAARIVSYTMRRDTGIFGRRTLIVGTEHGGNEVLRKLRSRVDNGYTVVGFIDSGRSRIGEKLGGVEILGSIDNIGKVIREHRVTDVIFSTDTLSYTDILTVIGRSKERSVNFRLVPSSLEVIIGKTSIDQLEDIPLVQIDYNIDRSSHRFLKRVVDLVFGSILVLVLRPVLWTAKAVKSKHHERLKTIVGLLPRVIVGELSLVGRYAPEENAGDRDSASANGKAVPYLGRIGLTGLAHIQNPVELSPDEIEKYNLYYAKNQSFSLDLQIMFKSFLSMIQT